jgi:hypothetical protein
MIRYTPKELRSMSLKALDEAGRDLGLEFTKNHNRAERSRRILAAYAEADLQVVQHEDPVVSSLSSPPAGQGEPKPEFERLISEGDVPEEADAEGAPPGRGGVRPGAGRPLGMTDQLSAYARLPQQSHPAIRQGLCAVFQSWAVSVKCPEVALTPEEAEDLALPWTQAADLMGLTQKIPPWLMVALSCVWSTANIIKCKAALSRAAAEARKAEKAGAVANE